MVRILLYLLCTAYLPAVSQVRHIDTTAKGHNLTIIDFGADSKGFYLVEQRINQLTKMSDYRAISGSVQVIDADSIWHVGVRKNGYIWLSFQATDTNEFDYSHSVTRQGKIVRHSVGTIKACTVELPIDIAKKFLFNVW